MSGADGQRAAEPDQCRYCPNDADRDEAGFLHCIECGWTDNPGKVVGLYESLDRLRAELAETRAELAAVREERGKYGKGWRAAQVELAETRDRRDYLQGQLDIIYDAEYSRNDALKRRIEKMGTAGDALADAATETLRWSGLPSELWALLADARDAYRAARDAAPTQPPADDTVAPDEQSVHFHPVYGPMAETADLMSGACPLCPPLRRHIGRTCPVHDWQMLRAEVVRLRAVLTWVDANDRVEIERHRRLLAKEYGRASRTIGEQRGVIARLRLAAGGSAPASTDGDQP